MSTPVKPPGSPPAPGADAGAPEPARIEERPGELRELVEAGIEASSSERAAPVSQAALGGIEADLRAGRIDAEQAVERLVQRALSTVPAAHRPAIESQLRAAIAGDPTLLALRRDLERASHTE